MKCVILSPHGASREAIEEVIGQNKLLEVIASVASTAEAKKTLTKQKADVVFIEITTPGMDGYEFMDELPSGRPFKVFLSAKKELAKEAFDYDASDFILLPITPLSLLRAITKITKSNKNIIASNVNHNFIFIKTNRAILRIELKELLYIEALADYININTTTKRYTVHSTMKGILEKLPQNDFIRIHKSYIVRLDAITKIESDLVVLNKQAVPLSRAYRKALLERIDLLH